jgi:hypothetical protein
LTQGNAPESATCEEVALGISHKVGWFNIDDAPFIYIPRCNCACLDGFPQDFRLERIDLVVVSADLHHLFLRSSKKCAKNPRPLKKAEWQSRIDSMQFLGVGVTQLSRQHARPASDQCRQTANPWHAC